MSNQSPFTPHAQTPQPSAASGEDPDDASYGWAMFLTFTTAVLAISFAVCALAMVQSWWMLGIVFGVDLAVTALVYKVVLGAFVSPAYSALDAAKAVVEDASPKAAKAPLTVGRSMVAAHE